MTVNLKKPPLPKKLEWTRINNDVNGNPRYVVHFHSLNTRAEKDGLVGATNTKYELAIKRANRIGGRKYHNKSYGGGIVFQSYSLQETENAIARVIAQDETAPPAPPELTLSIVDGKGNVSKLCFPGCATKVESAMQVVRNQAGEVVFTCIAGLCLEVE